MSQVTSTATTTTPPVTVEWTGVWTTTTAVVIALPSSVELPEALG